MSDIASAPAVTPGAHPVPRPGLRERKKARTRATIRRAALELFERQGYTATTVAQIADAAEVSHTTFFRYFRSKEQVIVGGDDIDEEDRATVLAGIPPGLNRFDLLRCIVNRLYAISDVEGWTDAPQRLELIRTEPELLAVMRAESDRALAETTEFIGGYLGVPPDDKRLRVFVAAAAGVMFHVVDHTGTGTVLTLEECLEAIDLLEAGLPV